MRAQGSKAEGVRRFLLSPRNASELLRAKIEALSAYRLPVSQTDKQLARASVSGYNRACAAGGCNSAVECLLPKQGVVGSNPITRSTSPYNACFSTTVSAFSGRRSFVNSTSLPSTVRTFTRFARNGPASVMG